MALAPVMVGGCGGSGTRSASSDSPSATSRTTQAAAPSPAPRHHRPHSRLVHGAPIGATQRVHAGASRLAVTVSRVLDPVHGTAAVPPGTRAVGVMVTIANLAGATYDSTASGDWSLVPSSGAASPLFFRSGVCQTPLVDFESLIGVGETRSGCVAFSVGRGARIRAVRFSPHSRALGAVTWR